MNAIKKIYSFFIPNSVKPQLAWTKKFFLFSLNLLLTNPKRFLKTFPKAVIYNFFPQLSRKKFRLEMVDADQIDEAFRAFNRDGYVVIRDALSPDEISLLKKAAYENANDMIELDRLGKLPNSKKSGSLRFTYGDYDERKSWDYLAFNKKILPILKRIWGDENFSAAMAGGEFVLPGADYQTIHSDCAWQSAGLNTMLICVNYYVIDVAKENGPIRQIPGTQFFPTPSPWIENKEPQWMKECLITAPAGSALIRDPRAWHGGTPNTSQVIRPMPNCEYVSNNIPNDYLRGGAIGKKIIARKFIDPFQKPTKKAS